MRVDMDACSWRTSLSADCASAGSQVVKKDRDRRRKRQSEDCEPAGECPVEPRHCGGPCSEALPHRRPLIVPGFCIANWREGLLEELLNPFFVVSVHGVIPCCCKSFRSNRSARKTRTLTAVTEMPSAAATS